MDPAQRVPPFDHYGKKGLPRECFVYVVHAAVLSVFCLLFIHVQGMCVCVWLYIYLHKATYQLNDGH